ncbi:Protein-lysine N-methyltransferase efm6 [Basidiobolus ranarum]|uniref:Protein-lysine N-methyltransferase efm6 n=1 Tax=Basidiobolus ranarum TaxID=34480 RepID=A0ABR2WAB1_9FUNG
MVDEIPPTTFTTEYAFNDSSISPLIIHQDSNGDMAAGVGSTLWDTSYVLSKYIEKLAESSNQESTELNFLKEPFQMINKAVNCLELGSGTGLVGLVSGRVIANLKQLYLSDKPSILPLLKYNVSVNKFNENLSVSPLTIDWTDLEKTDQLLNTSIDLILCSDCLWDEKLHQPLLDAFVKFSNPQTMVLLAFESRKFEEEARFFAKFGDYFHFRDIKPNEQDETWRSEDIYLFVASRK